jgi:hypothetical protein
MRRRLAGTVAVVALSGCGSLLPHTPARGRSETGFLSSYAALQPEAGRTGVFAWRRPDIDFGPYDTVVIEQPSLRRKHDDVLPSPAQREALCSRLRAMVRDALKADFRVIDSIDDANNLTDDVLRIRLAVTTALIDLGDVPPQGEWQGWGDRPGRFALECEVVDGFNARPAAKMVVFDRTRILPGDSVTPWNECEPLFVRWAADVAWLIQPPPDGSAPGVPATRAAPSEPAEAGSPPADADPVST